MLLAPFGDVMRDVCGISLSRTQRANVTDHLIFSAKTERHFDCSPDAGFGLVSRQWLSHGLALALVLLALMNTICSRLSRSS